LQLMSFPLHCPDDKHVLVTFPVELVYPVWQEYKQFDPYVLEQDGVSSMALGGVTNKGQEMTLQTGTGWSHFPGGLIPGATHLTVDEPFKR